MPKRTLIKVSTKVAETRKFIYRLVKDEAELRGFINDYFPALQKELPTQASYDDLLTILLSKESCDAILKATEHMVDFLKEKNELTNEEVADIHDEILRIFDLSQPKLRIRPLEERKKSSRVRIFARRLLSIFGVVWLMDIVRWLWSKINSIRVEGGTIVIAGVAGSGLYLSIHSCHYEAGRSAVPLRGAAVPSTAAASSSRSINFCARRVAIIQEGEPDSPPQHVEASLPTQEAQQLINYLNLQISIHAPMLPNTRNLSSAPDTKQTTLWNTYSGLYGRAPDKFYSQSINEPALNFCSPSQSDRLGIDLTLKWKKKANTPIPGCSNNQMCSELRLQTISCEFSYNVINQNQEYICPQQSFTITSSDISYLYSSNLYWRPDSQRNAKADIDLNALLAQCGSVFSAIHLLTNCRHR